MQLPDKLQETSTSFKRLNKAFNQLRDFVISLRPQISPTVHPKWNSAGISWEALVGGKAVPSNLKVRLMSIVSVSYSSVTAIPAPLGVVDLTATPEQVAKQANALGDNAAPYNIKTVNLGPPATSIIQDLVPPYLPGGFIYVVSGIDDHADNRLEVSPNRAWVDRLQLVCAKVNGVNKQMFIRGSTAV